MMKSSGDEGLGVGVGPVALLGLGGSALRRLLALQRELRAGLGPAGLGSTVGSGVRVLPLV